MDSSIKITGLEDVRKALGNLPRSTRNKMMRPALRRGAAVVRDAASANVKAIANQGYATGLLAKSLRVYSLRAYYGMLRVAVMVRRGLVTSKGVRVGLYAAVLEYGKENQPPRSWLRKAAREQKDVSLRAISQEASKRLPDAVKDAKK